MKNDINELHELVKKGNISSRNKKIISSFYIHSVLDMDYRDKESIYSVLNLIDATMESDTWLNDVTFWEDLSTEMFDVIVTWANKVYDFLEIAYTNMQIAKIRGDSRSLSRWIETIVRCGIISDDGGESFQKYYRRIQKDGIMGDRNIAQINAHIFSQALEYRHLYESEREKANKCHQEDTWSLYNALTEQFDKLEAFLAGDYYKDMDMENYVENIRARVVDVRSQLSIKCGIEMLVEPEGWVNKKACQFDNNIHMTGKNEILSNEQVIPITLGMKTSDNSRKNKAKVKKFE
jgi:hypothetical protein